MWRASRGWWSGSLQSRGSPRSRSAALRVRRGSSARALQRRSSGRVSALVRAMSFCVLRRHVEHLRMLVRLLHLLHFSLGEARVRAHDARGHKAHEQHRGAVVPGSLMHSTWELGRLELVEKGRCSICVFIHFILKVCVLAPWSSGLLLLFLHETDPTEPHVVKNDDVDIMLDATMARVCSRVWAGSLESVCCCCESTSSMNKYPLSPWPRTVRDLWHRASCETLLDHFATAKQNLDTSMYGYFLL